jgi:hypothetical protein
LDKLRRVLRALVLAALSTSWVGFGGVKPMLTDTQLIIFFILAFLSLVLNLRLVPAKTPKLKIGD